MVVGITGGIGSGKSEVTKYLRSLGEFVICADEVARQVVEPGEPCAQAIRKAFGSEFFNHDGCLNRSKLASHVFTDKERTLKLNETLHPVILSRIDELSKAHNGRVFIDAALLIQAGMYKNVDCVWLVSADLDTRIARVLQRDDTDKQSVLGRIANQMSDEQMSMYADEIIVNNGSIEELHSRIDELLANFKKRTENEQ